MKQAETTRKQVYRQPQTDLDGILLRGPLLVIAPSGKTDEQIPVDDNPPIDEDPNAAPLRNGSDAWEKGLW